MLELSLNPSLFPSQAHRAQPGLPVIISCKPSRELNKNWDFFFFLVALSFLGISPHGMFLLGHSWRFQMFWERFCGFFHFLFSCLKELEKQLLVPSLNGRAGNSLDLQTSLGKLQELEGGRSKVI